MLEYNRLWSSPCYATQPNRCYAGRSIKQHRILVFRCRENYNIITHGNACGTWDLVAYIEGRGVRREAWRALRGVTRLVLAKRERYTVVTLGWLRHTNCDQFTILFILELSWIWDLSYLCRVYYSLFGK